MGLSLEEVDITGHVYFVYSCLLGFQIEAETVQSNVGICLECFRNI